jgi:hypothetical protein
METVIKVSEFLNDIIISEKICHPINSSSVSLNTIQNLPIFEDNLTIMSENCLSIYQVKEIIKKGYLYNTSVQEKCLLYKFELIPITHEFTIPQLQNSKEIETQTESEIDNFTKFLDTKFNPEQYPILCKNYEYDPILCENCGYYECNCNIHPLENYEYDPILCENCGYYECNFNIPPLENCEYDSQQYTYDPILCENCGCYENYCKCENCECDPLISKFEEINLNEPLFYGDVTSCTLPSFDTLRLDTLPSFDTTSSFNPSNINLVSDNLISELKIRLDKPNHGLNYTSNYFNYSTV